MNLDWFLVDGTDIARNAGQAFPIPHSLCVVKRKGGVFLAMSGYERAEGGRLYCWSAMVRNNAYHVGLEPDVFPIERGDEWAYLEEKDASGHHRL